MELYSTFKYSQINSENSLLLIKFSEKQIYKYICSIRILLLLNIISKTPSNPLSPKLNLQIIVFERKILLPSDTLLQYYLRNLLNLQNQFISLLPRKSNHYLTGNTIAMSTQSFFWLMHQLCCHSLDV